MDVLYRLRIDSLRFKGIVQRDVRGVESRLKRTAFLNYRVALDYFFIIKGTLLREK
jgi:hypothetical protein